MSTLFVTIRKGDGSLETLQSQDSGRSFQSKDEQIKVSKPQDKGSEKKVNMYVGEEFREIPCQAVPSSSDLICKFAAESGRSVEVRFSETATAALASRATPVLATPAPATYASEISVAARRGHIMAWAQAEGRENPRRITDQVLKRVKMYYGDKRPIPETSLRAFYDGYVTQEGLTDSALAAPAPSPAPRSTPTPAPTPVTASAMGGGDPIFAVHQRESKIVEWATVENRMPVSHPQKLAKAVIKVVDGHYGKRPIPEQYLRAYYNGYVVKEAAKAGATSLPIAPAKSETPPPAPAAAPVKKITFGTGWIQIGQPKAATPPVAAPPPPTAAAANAESPKAETAKPEPPKVVRESSPTVAPTGLSPDLQKYVREMRSVFEISKAAFERLAEVHDQNEHDQTKFALIPLQEFKKLFAQWGLFIGNYNDLKSEHGASTQPEIQALIRDFNQLYLKYDKADKRADRLLRARGLLLVKTLEEKKEALTKMIGDKDISSKVFRTAKNSWITDHQTAKKEIKNVTHIVNEATAKEWNKEIDKLKKEVLALKWSGGSVEDKNLAKALDALQNRLSDVEQKLSNDMSLQHVATKLFRDVNKRIKSLQSSYVGKEEARFQALESRHAEVQQKVQDSQKIFLDLIDGYENRMGDIEVFGPFAYPSDYDWLSSEAKTTEGPLNRTLLKQKAQAHKNTLNALLGPSPSEWEADVVVDEARRDLPKWKKQWQYADKLITRVNLYEKSRKLPALTKTKESQPSTPTPEELAQKERSQKFMEYADRMYGHIHQVADIYKVLFDERGRDRNGHSLAVLRDYQQIIVAADRALVEPFDDKELSLVEQDLLNMLSADRADKLGHIPKILNRIDRDIKAIQSSLPPTALTAEQLGKIDPHLRRVEEIRGQLFEGPGKPRPTPSVEVLQGYKKDLNAAISIFNPVDDPRTNDPQFGPKKQIRSQLELSKRLLSYVDQKSKTAEQDARTRELDGIKGQLDGYRNDFGKIKGDRDASHEKKIKQLQELRQQAAATLQSLDALKKAPMVEARVQSLENGLKKLSGDAQTLEASLTDEKTLQEQLARFRSGIAKANALLDTQDPDTLQKNLMTLKGILADLEVERIPEGENGKNVQGKRDEAIATVKGKIGFIEEKIQKNSPQGRFKQLKERLAEPLQTRLSVSPDGNEITFGKVAADDIKPYIQSIDSHISEIYGRSFQGVLIVVRGPDEEDSAKWVKQAIGAAVNVAAMAIVRDPSRSDATMDLTLFLNPAPFGERVKALRDSIKKKIQEAPVPPPPAPTLTEAPAPAPLPVPATVTAPAVEPAKPATEVTAPVEPAKPATETAQPVDAPRPATETAKTEPAPAVEPARPATETAAPAVPFKAPKIVGLFTQPPQFTGQNLGKAYKTRIVYAGQFSKTHFETTSDKPPVVQGHLEQITQVTKDAGEKRVLVIYRIKDHSLRKVYESMVQKETLVSGVTIYMRERKILSAGDNSDAQVLYVILKEGDDPEKIFKNHINYIKGEH